MKLDSAQLTRVLQAAATGEPCPIPGAEDVYAKYRADLAQAPKGVMVAPAGEFPDDSFDGVIAGTQAAYPFVHPHDRKK